MAASPRVLCVLAYVGGALSLALWLESYVVLVAATSYVHYFGTAQRVSVQGDVLPPSTRTVPPTTTRLLASLQSLYIFTYYFRWPRGSRDKFEVITHAVHARN